MATTARPTAVPTTTSPAASSAASTGSTDSTDSTTVIGGRWKAGLAAAAVASVGTFAVAAIAQAAGVSFEVAGEAIPVVGFPQMTFLFSVVGIVLASALARWARRPQRTFVISTVALTALSLVPDLTAQTDAGSRLVLMATHVLAAAIVIPVVARRLPASR